MSFQTDIDNAKAQTGKTPDDFRALAQEAGLTTHGAIVAWLKADHGLGHGHANAVTQVILHGDTARPATDDAVAKHFVGAKATWREAYDGLYAQVQVFGPDVTEMPTSGYISWARAGRKFAIVQVTGRRFDVGLKLKGEPDTETYTEAGAWNAMVTHRRQITDDGQIDDDLVEWLRRAYDGARSWNRSPHSPIRQDCRGRVVANDGAYLLDGAVDFTDADDMSVFAQHWTVWHCRGDQS